MEALSLELYKNRMSFLGANVFFTNEGIPKEAQWWLGGHGLRIHPIWGNLSSSEPFRTPNFQSLTSNWCSFIIEYVNN